jgi:hypothetical protein
MDYLDRELINLAQRLKMAKLSSSVVMQVIGITEYTNYICIFDPSSQLASVMQFIIDCESYYPDTRERLSALLKEIGE